jgi:drug/metabolite transporter (DMT)-like permease
LGQTAESEQLLGALAAFATSVTWAFASARYAEASRGASGVRVNLVRAIVASLVWSVALLLLDGPRALHQVSARHALLLAGSIACSYAIGDNIFFAAARRIGISAALAVATIYPLWAALYGVLFRGEPFGVQRALGLVACLAGITALLAQSRHDVGATEATRKAGLAGVALALITSLFWAGNAVCLKLGGEGLSLYVVNAVRFCVGALLLAAQLPLEKQRDGARPASLRALLLALWIPLLADTGLGSICYTYGITHTDLALGATLSSLSPLVALPIAAANRTEQLTLAKIVSVVVTVAGVVLLLV